MIHLFHMLFCASKFPLFSDNFFSGKDQCDNLILSIKLEVLFAFQGALANPQQKIVGVLLTHGPPSTGPLVACQGLYCPETELTGSEPKDIQNESVTFEISWSVDFIDVSRPSKPLHPRPPRLDLKLPYDFFYPYLPNSGVILKLSCLLHFILIINILV